MLHTLVRVRVGLPLPHEPLSDEHVCWAALTLRISATDDELNAAVDKLSEHGRAARRLYDQWRRAGAKPKRRPAAAAASAASAAARQPPATAASQAALAATPDDAAATTDDTAAAVVASESDSESEAVELGADGSTAAPGDDALLRRQVLAV